MRSFSFFFALAILACFIAGVGFSQTPPWERINPFPVESSLKDYQILPNDRIIAVGTHSTIIYSDDQGNNWDILYNPAGVSNMHLHSIHFVNDNRGFAVGSNFSIIRTDDGGNSWIDLSNEATHSSDVYNDVFITDENTGYIIEKSKQLLKTIDGGLSWDTIFSTGTYTLTEIQFVNQFTGYLTLSGDSGFLQTDDAGLNWEYFGVNHPVEDFNINALCFISEEVGFVGAHGDSTGYSEHLILKTSDGGGTWEQVYSDGFNSVSQFFFLNKDTGYSIGAVVWYSNNILKTTDGGETWQEITDHIGTWKLNGLGMHESGIGHCVGDYGQIFKTTDYGTNWDKAYSNQAFMFDFYETQLFSDSIIYACGKKQYYWSLTKSTDSGYTWTNCHPSILGGTSYFLNADTGFTCDEPTISFYRTYDGGDTWQGFEITFTSYFWANSIWFMNASLGFIAGAFDYDAAIYKTIDGGENWYETIISPNNNLEIKDLVFISESKGIAVSDDGGDAYVFVTNDQGETWVLQDYYHNNIINKIYFISQDVGYLLGGNILLKTIDSGDTWEEVETGIEFIDYQDMQFVGPDIVYLTGTENEINILKSIDGGDTWFPLDPPCTRDMYALCFFNEDEGLVMGSNGTIFKTFTGGMVDIREWTNAKQPELNIYPNPSNGRIKIEIPDQYASGTLQVYSLQGQLVFACEYDNNNDLEINLKEQPGIYLINLTNGSSSITGKLILADP